MRIPFCPLPLRKAKRISKKFYGIAQPLIKISPGIKLDIEQAGFEMDPIEYMSIAIFSSLFMFSMIFVPLFIISLAVSSVLLVVTLMYLKMYPKLIVKKRVADLERNLLHALKHIYVQVKAGVSIFETFVSISLGDYGSVSKEFKYIVKEINSGTSAEAALEELALKNPSLYFRRAIWQLSNGIKAGSDVAIVLRSIIDNISAQQKIEIRRYGAKLNPMTLVYMMVAVIIPSLGVTFLIILSTFSGMEVSETMFWAILLFLAVFQFMFIGIIKSKRPNII